MRVVGLISGGKDSVFNMLQCIAAGHEIVAIANIEPVGSKDEMDSYMYQTVGHQTLALVSAAISLPIYRQKTRGVAICKEKVYVETPQDEVEDLFTLLSKVKEEMHIDGVSVGAISSDYQRTRVENVCMRLNLKCFAYLWRRDQDELLQEMIDAELNAIVVKVAALGLNPEVHLGANIKDLQALFLKLNNKFGINICGEGGEYETLTVDCPLYHRKIEIIASEKIIHSDDAFAPVGYLSIKNATLENKPWVDDKFRQSAPARMDYIRGLVRSPMYYVEDCLDSVTNKIFGENEVSSVSPEVLPFPFGSQLNVAGSNSDSKTALTEYWKTKSASLSTASHPVPQSSHVVTFSPSSLLNIDTTVVQLNHSTGWCCIGNVTAPSIKEGLGFVRKHLERYQYEFRDVVSVSLYVKDLGDWTKMNKIYSQTISTYCPPTRACVGVPLPNDMSVIIVVVAHRLVSRTQKVVHHTHHTVDRDFVHVQSISHWAPANIGPYSQSIRVGEIVYVSGQIPLVPGTMELLNRPVLHQCRLTLRHIFRILRAINDSYTMANIMQGICFVTSEETAKEITSLWNYITKNEHAAIAVVVVLSLPKNAQLEWQVLACGYDRPRVTIAKETISDDFTVKYKRCLYADRNTAALVSSVSFTNFSRREKSRKSLTPENIATVMRQCLHILRGDIVGSGTPLCMFNVYFKATESAVAQMITDTVRTCIDFKVVITCIPVVACEEPDIFLTVTGMTPKRD